MELTLDIQGGAQLAELLDALPDKMADNVMRGALRAGGNEIAQIAKNLVHVGYEPLPANHDPEDLRNAIGVSSGRGSRDQLVVKVGIDKKKAFWGRFVEFGTAAAPAKGGRRAHHATKAYPFMRPAFDLGALNALDAITGYAQARIDQFSADAGIYLQGFEE